MLDFRMETFFAVCKHLNFTKAAAELNLTQPAVSHHIHYLEEEYGVPLFTYTGKKLQLTRAGEMLRCASITMKHDDSQLKQRMQQLNTHGKSYSFGATLSVAEFILIENLERFIMNHMDYYITMQVDNTKSLLRKIDSGELDFAIVEGNFSKYEYDYYVYSLEEYVAVGNQEKAQRYSGRPFSDLFDECILLREQGSGTRDILEDYLKNNGYSIAHFRHWAELGNIGTIKTLLKWGYGISFLYGATMNHQKAENGLYAINLSDFHMVHEISFVFRKNSIFKKDYEEIFHELHQDK